MSKSYQLRGVRYIDKPYRFIDISTRFENIDIDIDIDKVILENIDIDKDILGKKSIFFSRN